MASGNDFRIALSKESTYGTRVAPARFLGSVTGEDISFERTVRSVRRWAWVAGSVPRCSPRRRARVRSRVRFPPRGSGSCSIRCTTTSRLRYSRLLARRICKPTRWIRRRSKSYSIQKQVPPVLSSTLLPIEYWGTVFTGITLSWTTAGLFRYDLPAIVREENTAQSLVSYVAPTGWSPFGFQGGAVKIASVLEGNIVGDGSITVGASLRDDAFALGTSGLMAKPVETDKPTASGSFTADFNDLTNINRVANNTVADVELTFEGAVISGTYKYMLRITLPDCVFTSPSPTVDGPGPVQQEVTFTAASTTNDPVVILYQSTDTVI